MTYSDELIRIPLAVAQQGNSVFYFGKMKASDLIHIFTVHPAKYDAQRNASLSLAEREERFDMRISQIDAGNSQHSTEEGQQRELSSDRTKEIAAYLDDSKNFALFPNAIIATCDLASDLGNSFEEFNSYIAENGGIGSFLIKEDDENSLHSHTLYITKEKFSLIIIDGQHRIEGIKRSSIDCENFEVLVTFILGVDRATIAKYFYTVNYNQKPVNRSLLYHLMGEFGTDLKEISYLHEIILALNEIEFSPFRGRIKMLGKSAKDATAEERAQMTLSQAFLIDYMKYTIVWNEEKQKSKRIPKLLPIFYWYYKNSGHVLMLRFILRYFTAAQEAFPALNDPNSQFSKTIGVGAMLHFMSDFFIKLAHEKDLLRNPSELDKIRAEDLTPLFKGIEHINPTDFPSSGAAGVGTLHKAFLELCPWVNPNPEDVSSMRANFWGWIKTTFQNG